MKIPPPELLLQVSNDPKPENYANVAHVLWGIEQPLIAAGYQFGDFDRILDFGCGVGRLLQALHPSRREGQELWGCDVNEACATWCRENLDFAKVAHTGLEPPLPYADDSFDLITAISVFTHLSRPLQVAWARELMRVLRPGGVAFITTAGLSTLSDVLAINDYWTSREFALLGATGHFLHFAVADESALEGQREVVALHSRDAIVQIFAPLPLAHHTSITPVAAGQDVSLFVKPASGCRVIMPGEPPSPQGVAAEVPANGSVSNVVTFRFQTASTDPAVFRSYIAFAERRFDLVHLVVDCRLRDTATGQTLSEGRFAFPSSVSRGPTHFVPFTLDGVVGPSVEIDLALALRRTPWQELPIAFRWWDARFEIGGPPPDVGGRALRASRGKIRLLADRMIRRWRRADLADSASVKHLEMVRLGERPTSFG